MNQRKDGRWQKSVRINGKRVFFYSSESTKEKAEKDIDRKLLAYQEEQHNSKHNFKVLADRAIEVRNISNATATSYRAALLQLKPLHEKDIEDIKPSNVQAILDDMGRKGYSFSAISKVRIFFGIVMDYAIVEEDLQIANFAKSLKTPKNAVKRKSTSPEEKVYRRS